MLNRLVIFLILLSLGSCRKEPSDSLSTDIVPDFVKWEIELPQDDDFITIHNPIIIDDIVIIPVHEQGVLLALDKESGDEVWRWTEAMENYEGADGFGYKSHIYENLLVTSQRNLTYAIDIETGLTVWHNRDEFNSYSAVNGDNEHFVYREAIPNEHIWVKLGNCTSGEVVSIFEYQREDDYNIDCSQPRIFLNDSNVYCSFVLTKWISNNEGYFSDSWLYLYNINNDELEWVSDTILVENSFEVPLQHERAVNEKLFLANNSVYAYDLMTGELVWIDNSHTNTFAWNTHLTAADGKVFGNNENGYMIALDVDTGQEIWRTDTGGTGSRIEYYDEKVYINEITRSGVSYLMVLDANSGEVLHDIPSPYEVFGENDWYWDDVITVDKETGLIYTADHHRVMCIELED